MNDKLKSSVQSTQSEISDPGIPPRLGTLAYLRRLLVHFTPGRRVCMAQRCRLASIRGTYGTILKTVKYDASVDVLLDSGESYRAFVENLYIADAS